MSVEHPVKPSGSVVMAPLTEAAPAPDDLLRWWIVGPGQQPAGPWDAVKLRVEISQGRFSTMSMVCRVGSDRWIPLRDEPDLIRGVLEEFFSGGNVIYPTGVPVTAVIACWLGVVGMVLLFPAPIALMLGIIGLRGTRKTYGRGRGRAIVGIVLGGIGTTAMLVLLLDGLVL